jgi:WD40 repeat protein
LPDNTPIEKPANFPLPGMRPYGEEASSHFHGRSRQVEDLLSIIQSSRFIGLAGPEASGKTSLVMAGLLPVLRAGFRGVAGSLWRICHCTPGITPIENLTFALAGAAAEGSDDRTSLERQHEFTALLRGDHSGLQRITERIGLHTGENLLIIIDRLEELFELAHKHLPGVSGAVETDLLMGNIARMLSTPGLPVYLMVIIESEHIPSLYNFRNLHAHLSGGLYTLPLFRQDDLNAIVSQGLSGAHIQPTMEALDQIRMEFGQDLRNLYALQLYMAGIIDRFGQDATSEKPKKLEASDLELVPSMGNIIPHRLDAFHDALPKEERHLMHQVFSHIVQSGEGHAMKKPQTVREIADRRALDKQALSTFLRKFDHELPGILSLTVPYDRQLLHFREQGLPDSAVVTLSATHPVRHWKRLQEWVVMEREAETLYRRLSDAARLHTAGQSGYLRPPDLDVYQKWWDTFNPQPSWAAQFNTQYRPTETYLRDSHQKHIEETERRERERKEELKKARKRVLVGVVVAIISVMLAGWAWNESIVAEKERKKASEKELIAKQALEKAKKEERAANDAKEDAEEKGEEARIAKDIALEEKLKADTAKLEAIASLSRAEVAEKRAKRNQQEALDSAAEARIQREKAREAARKQDELRIIASRNADFESAGKQILSLYNKATTGRFESATERINFIRDVSAAYEAYDSSSRNKFNGKVMPDRYLFDILSIANRQIKEDLNGKNTVRQVLADIKIAGLRDIAIFRRDRIAAVGDQTAPVIFDRVDGKSRTVKIQGNDARLRAVAFIDRDSLLFISVRGDLFLSDLKKDKTTLLGRSPQPANVIGGLVVAGQEILTIIDGKLFAYSRRGGSVAPARMLDVQQAVTFFESSDGVSVLAARGIYFAPAGSVNFRPVNMSGLLSKASALSLQGDRLFVGNEAGQIMAYRRNGSGQPFAPEWREPIPAHRTKITAIRFDPQSERLFTASLDRTAGIYDLTLPMKDLVSGDYHVKLQGFKKWIWDFELVPGKPSATLYSVDEQGELTAWITMASEMHNQIEQFLKTTGSR